MRILIAEDDSFSLQILEMILSKEPAWQVVSVKDGAEAWNVLQQSAPFDVGIFDIMMPGLDGLQLLTKVRTDPRFAELSIIFCTALNDRATVKQAAALGVSHYITKPYQRDSIFKQLRRIAAERGTGGRIEPLANVVERLGIDEELLRTMLTSLQTEIEGFLATLRDAAAPPATADFSLKVNALKGAAANLGAVRMASRLATLESVTAPEWKSVVEQVSGENVHLRFFLQPVAQPA